MGEYLGLFIFLGIFLMAFWILIFLVTFLGFWSVMGALNSLFPAMFEKAEDDAHEAPAEEVSTEA